MTEVRSFPPGRQWRRRTRGVAALLALALATFTATPASAYALEGCDWNRRIIDIDSTRVESNSKWMNSLVDALAQYNDRTDVTVIRRNYTGPSFKAEANLYGNTGWNGHATWRCVLGSLHSATIKMNRSTSEMKNGSRARVALTWQHEIGHALGLAHVTPVKRVMHGGGTGYAWNAGIRVLTSDEINGINYLY